MSKRVQIPVRVIQAPNRPPVVADPRTRPVAAPVEPLDAVAPPLAEWPLPVRREQVARLEEQVSRLQTALEAQQEQVAQVQSQAEEQQERAKEAQATADDWREQALRLRAEMDNFRKRQRRLAQDEIEGERRRLLTAFLEIVDDLERALTAPPGDADALRQGVDLTHRAALQLLRQEGVEPIQAKGQPFDPDWHEAAGTIAGNGSDAEADTVVHVLRPGYRRGDTLLRPAQVIVAV